MKQLVVFLFTSWIHPVKQNRLFLYYKGSRFQIQKAITIKVYNHENYDETKYRTRWSSYKKPFVFSVSVFVVKY